MGRSLVWLRPDVNGHRHPEIERWHATTAAKGLDAAWSSPLQAPADAGEPDGVRPVKGVVILYELPLIPEVTRPRPRDHFCDEVALAASPRPAGRPDDDRRAAEVREGTGDVGRREDRGSDGAARAEAWS